VYSDGDVLEYELRDYEMVINATGVAGNGTNISSEVIEVSRITIFFPELTRKSGNITLKYGSSRFTSKIYRTWTFSILIPTTAYKTAIRMRFPKGTLFTSLPMNIRVGFEENTLILASESYIFGFACKYEIISPGPEVDNEPPLITLQSPSNNSVMLEGTVIFRYNVEDEKSGISSCRLIVDGVVEQVNNSIKKEGMNQFTYMVKGESFWNDYEWSIECIDDSPSENRRESEVRNLKVISPLLIGLGVALLIMILFVIFIIRRKRKKKSKEDAGKEELKEKSKLKEKEEHEEDVVEEVVEEEKQVEGEREIKDYVLKLLDENETTVVRLLARVDNEVTQAYIYKTTGMPKATLSDVMRRLEDKDVVERKREGRTKWVKLNDWIFE